MEAVAYGVKVYGVTIHWVDATLDGGRIIAQRAFAYDGDDVHRGRTARARDAVEHGLHVETIDKLVKAEDRDMRALISVSDKRASSTSQRI